MAPRSGYSEAMHPNGDLVLSRLPQAGLLPGLLLRHAR
jgi:hypothetical protein